MSIKWHIGVEPEFSTELAGTKIGDYFLNPDVAAQTQIASVKKMYELFGYGEPEAGSIGVPCVYGPYVTANILGTKLVYPEDDMPQIVEYALKNIKEVKSMKVPDIDRDVGIIRHLLETYEYLKKHYEPMGIKVGKPGAGGCSPLSTAVSLRGGGLFSDMVIEPGAVKDLMEIISETEIRLTKLGEEISGVKVEDRGGIGFEDDFGGLISPEMHEEFVFPYMKRKCDTFPVKERSIHSETYSRGHLRLLRELGITYYDAWPYHNLTAKDVLEELPGTFFTWNFLMRDLLSNSPEEIKSKFRRAAADGAPGMALDLCGRGVPRENIKAFIEVAKEFSN